jgi:hypothetical protein
MSEISDKAKTRGMTPDVLENIFGACSKPFPKYSDNNP